MPGGRPPGPHVAKTYSGEQVAMTRLQGESDGRTLGRISERTTIVEWLKWQSGTPKDLADRISRGEHTRPPSND